MPYLVLFFTIFGAVSIATTNNPGIDIHSKPWQLILASYIFMSVLIIIRIIIEHNKGDKK